MKYKYLTILIYLIITLGCSGQKIDKKLIEQNWISDLKYDAGTNDFDFNTILILKQGHSFAFELGKKNEAFEFIYKISNEVLSVGEKYSPMKIIKLDSQKMILNLNKVDTVEFNSFTLPKINKEELFDKILHHSFELIDDQNSINYLVHFEEKDLLILSNDLSKENIDFPKLSFTRVKYQLSFIEDIPTIMIFSKLKHFDYPIIGLINLMTNTIHIQTYMDKKIHVTKLNAINNNTDLKPGKLIDKWTLGAGKNKQIFDFKKNGELIYTVKEEVKYWKWYIDESGYLITIIDENGNRKYGVKNFKTAPRRIGYEFLNGRFSDMLNLK